VPCGSDGAQNDSRSSFSRAPDPAICAPPLRLRVRVFLIGDDPDQVLDHDRGLIGVLSRVSVGSADTLLMPLGPRHVGAIASSYEAIELRASAVARINRIEVLGAQEKGITDAAPTLRTRSLVSSNLSQRGLEGCPTRPSECSVRSR
jgi:hypothetical protein